MQLTRLTAAYVVLAAVVASTSVNGTEIHASGAPQRNPNAARPSFDCTQATSAREKLICGDQELSKLDGKLGHLYHERTSLLSARGTRLLQKSERSWLHYVGTVCSLDVPDDTPRLSRKPCLKNQYNERISQLEAVAQQIGPYIFNRIDLYAARPAEDKDGAVAGFYVQHAAYPQIDNENSPEVRAWNKANLRDLPTTNDDCGPGDYATTYEVGYANIRVISVEWTNSNYCHGAAHGMDDVHSDNTVLLFPLRSLTAHDLFRPGEAWASILKERFWTALAQGGWRPPENQPNMKQELENYFIQPDRWLFTKDGLRVNFGSYEGGCYLCTPPPVTLPWSELKPVLSSSAIAP